MNQSEAAELLTVMAAYNRRTIGDADVLAWSTALDDIRLADAMAAVHKHHRESSEWLDPNHVRRLVKAVRADRLEHAPHLTPPAHLADDPAAQNDWLRRARALIADGADPATAQAYALDSTSRPVSAIDGTFRTIPNN